MATIPIDVMHSCILPRLPVKSLIRFKSVSKSWQTIISSPEFIHLHHQHALYSDANRLFIFEDNTRLQKKLHVYELDSPLTLSVHWYHPKPKPIIISNILASSEFFLLINLYRNIGLILLNPSTGRYYQIPYPLYHNGIERYGMYLDEANHDYKIARITQTGETNTEVMVYSLRTNKWRVIGQRFDICYRVCGNATAAIRHLLHILFVPSSQEHLSANAKKRIGCFDILAEKWTNDVPFPHINNLERIKLTVLDGLLCVTGLDLKQTGSHNYSAWIMKEYGVENSWLKLFSIARGHILDSGMNPIAFRKGSQDEVLCRRYHGLSKLEYIWYNVREKKATPATIQCVYGYICKGSLVDFPGGRNMKIHPPKQEEETIRFSVD